MGDGFWDDPSGEDDIPESDRDLIDDPDALRRAEEAVSHPHEEPERWVPVDTVWTPVAAAPTSAAHPQISRLPGSRRNARSSAAIASCG